MNTLKEYVELLRENDTLEGLNLWFHSEGRDQNRGMKNLFPWLRKMLENADMYLQGDPTDIKDIFSRAGLVENEGDRYTKESVQYAFFVPIKETLGVMGGLSHRFSPDPSKPLLFGKRREFVLVPGEVYHVGGGRDEGGLFEWLNGGSPIGRSTRFDFDESELLRYNHAFNFQGAVDSEETYQGLRSVALPIFEQIVEQDIPAVWHGRASGSDFCLVNP